MIDVSEIAASVVLYNSPLSRSAAIETYRVQVDRLYVVDNSEGGKTDLAHYLIGLPNVVYISSEKNEGIASALNRAASKAISDGYSYLLTMDDDTAVPENLITAMTSFLNEYDNASRVGILAASHSDEDSTLSIKQSYKKVLYTMTSGNLLNLNIYRQVGLFCNDFFIDHVDHDYGLRINQAQFEVIELPELKLFHQLGERRQIRWTNMKYVSHAPTRGYYFVRNGLVLAQKYKYDFPDFHRKVWILLIKEFFKALFFEPQKAYRLRLLWQGVVDKCAGRFGKLAE